MDKVTERLMRYCAVYTPSKDGMEAIPSTECQWDLARMLEKELRELGVSNVYVSEYCYVYGEIPANAEGIPAVAFIAHMDTVPTPKAPVPVIKTIDGAECVASDGTTILGADDKAGVAEIVTMAEYFLAHPEIRHGKIGICFTPDEEVGNGPKKCELDRIACDFGYTVDGGPIGEVSYENFNAAAAKIKFNGVAAHPGGAKGAMINAVEIACEFNAMLPADQKPQYTEGYEGFYHLVGLSGDVSSATAVYILRSFRAEESAKQKETVKQIGSLLDMRYGKGTVEVEISDTYRNMREVVEKRMEIVEIAEEAFRSVGVEPVISPVRGGTDGATISWMGMPCPNLSTGGYGFHGLSEHIPTASMAKMVDTLISIVTIVGQKG